eukprot:15849064-Heterocapsa_arctica.AAC.1
MAALSAPLPVALLVPCEVAMAAVPAGPVALPVLRCGEPARADQGAREGPTSAEAPGVVVAGRM